MPSGFWTNFLQNNSNSKQYGSDMRSIEQKVQKQIYTHVDP